MFKLTPEQMTLRIANEAGFIDWYVNEFMPEHLSNFHRDLDNEDLVLMVRKGRNEAIHYGFNDPYSQVHFVTLMFKLGPTFHHFPGFWEIASATHIPGPERIEQFYQVPDELGADAVLNTNDYYWFRDDCLHLGPQNGIKA